MSGNSQQAPYPEPLVELLAGLEYLPNWKFELGEVDRGQGCSGLTLTITVFMPDSGGEGRIGVVHYMPVPPAAYNRKSWMDWLFEQVGLVERHERGEFFRIDGYQHFACNHEDGNNPYIT